MSTSSPVRLLCPLDALELERVPSGRDGLAVHFCGRHEYPEVCGIPVLLDTPAARAALEAARAGDAAAARAELLAPGRWGRSDTLARIADRISGAPRFSALVRARRVARFRRRHGDGPFRSYREALAALLLEPPSPQPASFHYFFNRPSDPTFLVAEAVTSGVPDSGEVLDLCCGSGQVTRILARAQGRRITGLDESFALLYLARTHLAPGARLVCARADRPLPFPSGSFDAAVCSDALHDTGEPALLAREILRVLDAAGTAFVVHLHNPAFEHLYRGRNPLAPAGYAAIFEAGQPRLLDERALLDSWLERREVDLSASRPPQDLVGARTLTLLAGATHADRLHRPPPIAPVHLVLNPLYHAHPEADGLSLHRVWPSPDYPREYPEAGAYLPERAQLGPAELGGLRENRLAAEAVELFRRRVILDLPEGYGAERPWDLRA